VPKDKGQFLTNLEANSQLAHRPSLKPFWFITAICFAISFVVSVTMIVQTMNWLRLKRTDLPAWYQPMTTLSEWGLTLSSFGLLVLAAITILRHYRDK